MKAVNIMWDIEYENSCLPTEMEIPESLKNDEDAISDYLSDVSGFCHFGFELVK